MGGCSALNCRNVAAKGLGLTFHSFPLKDPELLKQWLKNMRREDWEPKRTSKLCNEHFEEQCFDRSKRARLHLNAVPTIFNFPTHYKTPQKRILKEENQSPVTRKSRRITDEGKDNGTSGPVQRNSSPDNEEEEEEEEEEERLQPFFKSETPILRGASKKNYIYLSPTELKQEEGWGNDVDTASNGSGDLEENSLKKNSKTPSLEQSREEEDEDEQQDFAIKKLQHLPDGRTYFEFNKRTNKVVLQLQGMLSCSKCLKTDNLEELIDSLKSQLAISHNTEALLEAFVDLPKGLERRDASNGQNVKKKWSKDVERFASVLYLSPKAYDLISTVFKLPGKKFLQARLKVDHFHPGFTQESLTILKDNVSEKKSDRICSIMMEFVDLRKQGGYDSLGHKWTGHVGFRGNQERNDSDELPLASELLMFTAVGIGTNWKLPFGYFLSKGFAGEDLQCLVHEAILILESCDLNVKALICNGSRTTVKMGKLLGCSIHEESLMKMTTYFPHPSNDKQKIHLIFGFQGVFKLLMHLLADKGSLKSSAYGLIKWKFFRLLFDGDTESNGENHEDLSELILLQRIIKLTNPGFTYAVSKALSLAEEMGSDEYHGCSAAARFTDDMNCAFDVLNSRNPNSDDKPPLSLSLLIEQLESTYNMMKRIFEISPLSGRHVARGIRWMSVTLLTFTLKSVATLASELLNQKCLEYLPTYRLNLDHSAALLRSIQRRGGWDSTPTTEEFKNGYEDLLAEAFSICSHSKVFNNDFEGEDLTISQGVFSSNQNQSPSKLSSNIMVRSVSMAYIVEESDVVVAKCIIKHIAHNMCCSDCVALMLENNDDVFSAMKWSIDNFTPSRFVLRILQTCERYLLMGKLEESLSEEYLVIQTFSEFIELSGGLECLKSDHVNEEPYHGICLIKAIIRTYVNFKRQSIKELSKIKATHRSLWS